MREKAIIDEIKKLYKKLEIVKLSHNLKEQIYLKDRINELEKKAKFYEIKNIEMECDQNDQHKRR